MNKITLIVNKDNEGKRLDQFLTLNNAAISRSKVIELIKKGDCLVNSKIEKPHYIVNENDVIEFTPFVESPLELKEEDVPFSIVYEDEYLLVIDKPRGIIVHPGNGHKDGTLVNGLLYRKKELAESSSYIRPGIVHRIDKDTSGLLVVAKQEDTLRELQQQLSSHSMHREYKAIVKGIIKENEGKIIAPIGRDSSNRIKMAVDISHGKEAITNFKVLDRFASSDSSYIECYLETGRTHQIRVHMDYIGHPLLGDPLYGKGNRTLFKDGQLLHAYRLTFFHPNLKKEMSFTSPLPEYFSKALSLLS